MTERWLFKPDPKRAERLDMERFRSLQAGGTWGMQVAEPTDLTDRPVGEGPFAPHAVHWYTGLTRRQLRYWKDVGWVVPSVRVGEPGTASLYSRDDVLRLREIAVGLHEGRSVQNLRKTLGEPVDNPNEVACG